MYPYLVTKSIKECEGIELNIKSFGPAHEIIPKGCNTPPGIGPVPCLLTWSTVLDVLSYLRSYANGLQIY